MLIDNDFLYGCWEWRWSISLRKCQDTYVRAHVCRLTEPGRAQSIKTFWLEYTMGKYSEREVYQWNYFSRVLSLLYCLIVLWNQPTLLVGFLLKQLKNSFCLLYCKLKSKYSETSFVLLQLCTVCIKMILLCSQNYAFIYFRQWVLCLFRRMLVRSKSKQ